MATASPPHTIASAQVPAQFDRARGVAFVNDFVGKALDAYKSGVPRDKILETVFPDSVQRMAAEGLLGAIGESTVTGLSMAKMFGGNIDNQIGTAIDRLSPEQKALTAQLIGGPPTTVTSRLPTPRPDPTALASASASRSSSPSNIGGRYAPPPNGVPQNVIDGIIKIESGGKANAKNPRSSATGAGQFIKSTWRAMVSTFRPDLMTGRTQAEIDALRNDPALAREMVGNYAAQNTSFLQNRGVPVNAGSLYLAHFLGPAQAASVLRQNPNATLTSVLPSSVINANPFLREMTVSGLSTWASNKMGGGSDVKTIQTELKNAGFLGANGKPLTVDGIVGPNTRAALDARRELQTQQARTGSLPPTLATPASPNLGGRYVAPATATSPNLGGRYVAPTAAAPATTSGIGGRYVAPSSAGSSFAPRVMGGGAPISAIGGSSARPALPLPNSSMTMGIVPTRPPTVTASPPRSVMSTPSSTMAMGIQPRSAGSSVAKVIGGPAPLSAIGGTAPRPAAYNPLSSIKAPSVMTGTAGNLGKAEDDLIVPRVPLPQVPLAGAVPPPQATARLPQPRPAAPAPVRSTSSLPTGYNRQVAELQSMINLAGVRDFTGSALKVDGVMGPRTQFAAQQYVAQSSMARPSIPAPPPRVAAPVVRSSGSSGSISTGSSGVRSSSGASISSASGAPRGSVSGYSGMPGTVTNW